MELVHPEAMAQNDDRRRSHRLLTGSERASQRGLHPDDIEEAVGYDSRLHAQRIAVPVELE